MTNSTDSGKLVAIKSNYAPKPRGTDFEEGIIEALCERISKEFALKDELSAKSFPLRPSSVGKDARELALSLQDFFAPGTHEKDPLPPRSALVFDMGDRVERSVLFMLEKVYPITYKQVAVHLDQLDGHDINGHIDGVIEINGEKFILDVKSISEMGFKSIPKDDHIRQVNLYLHSDWAKKLGLKKGILFYQNKNNQDICPITFDYDEQKALSDLARFRAIYVQVQTGLLPEFDHLWGETWHWGYSRYRTAAWKNFLSPDDNPCTHKIIELTEEIQDLKNLIEGLEQAKENKDKEEYEAARWNLVRFLVNKGDGSVVKAKSLYLVPRKYKTTMNVDMYSQDEWEKLNDDK